MCLFWRSSRNHVPADRRVIRLEGFKLDASGRRYTPLLADDTGDFEVAALGLKQRARADELQARFSALDGE